MASVAARAGVRGGSCRPLRTCPLPTQPRVLLCTCVCVCVSARRDRLWHVWWAEGRSSLHTHTVFKCLHPTCRGERITFKTNTTTNVTTVSGFNDEDAALTPADAAFVTTDGEQDSVAVGVVHIISAVLFPRRTTLGTLAGARLL